MPGRTLNHPELFRLFCREAVRDGPRTREDDELLDALQELLRLDFTEARSIRERAPPPDPGEARPLDRRRAFAAACRLAWEDGDLENRERNLLMGLAQFLSIPNEEARSLLTQAVLQPAAAPGPARTQEAPAAEPGLLDDTHEAALHRAARDLDPGAVATLLADGADVHERDSKGWTALHWACRSAADSPERAEEVAAALLAAGAEAEAPGQDGRRALHLAARAGSGALVRRLVAAGASPTAREWDRGQQPLHMAARHDGADAVAALIEAGAPRDAPDDSGASPLHRAAAEGAAEAVRALLEAGARASASNLQGETPLHLARQGEHFEAAVHLEAREAPDRHGPEGLRAGAEEEDPVALLAMAHAAGSPEVSLAYLRRAHDAGHAEATVLLSRRLRRGDDGPPDQGEARNLLVLAAETEDHPVALLELGRIYLDPEDGPVDLEKGWARLRRAAYQGSPEAMEQLAEKLQGEGAESQEAAQRWASWARDQRS